MEIAAVFGVLIVLMIIGVPIAFSMGLAALLGFYLSGLWDIASSFTHNMYTGSTGFILVAIPFYILAGLLMNNGGTTQRIVKFAQNLVGHITGGMGHVNILASIVFAGMSGSAVADSSGLGMVEMKAMTEAGYDKKFSAAITAASSTIGPIIPPSIPLVVFGGMTSVSVGRLFLGGIIPGLIMGVGLMIAVYIIAAKRKYPKTAKASFKELARSAMDAIIALGTVIIILGGILTGIFTPTEAAIVASIYALIIGLFVFRDLKIKDLPAIFWETAENSLRVLFILAAAAAYANVLTLMHVPEKVFAMFSGLAHNPVLLLLIINAILLFLGCFMEALSVMLLTVPILLPIVIKIGVDPVHFGVMMTLNLMIGLITPPVGLCLYSVSVVSKLCMQEIVAEVWPYLIALIVVLFLITYIPQLTLWLPNLLMH